jgi:hypothetical protein
LLLNQSQEIEDDEAIFKRKMKKLQMEKEEQGPVIEMPPTTSLLEDDYHVPLLSVPSQNSQIFS